MAFKKSGDVLTLTTPAGGLAEGEGAIFNGGTAGAFFAVAADTYAAGDSGEFYITGVHELTKLSTDVLTDGDLVYWDDTQNRVERTSAAGLKLIGYAVAGGAANGDTTVQVLLIPGLSTDVV